MDNLRYRKTSRLILREPVAEDRAFTVDLFSRQELVAHRPNPVTDSAEVSAQRLLKDIAHWARCGFGRWAVICDGDIIGFGGLTQTDDTSDLNISYHLHPVMWGRGLASEIVSESLKIAFGSLGAVRVRGLVRGANPASARVLEKHGFVHEGKIGLHGAPTNVLAHYGMDKIERENC
ncbi:GNAT family N-acetyltransferase [Actibacterium sp. D379-3]